jgi:hypothetical protein
MEYLPVNPGDFFLVDSSNLLGTIINSVQKFWAYDNNSIYSHAGLIIDRAGTTFELRLKAESRNFFKACKNRKVLIARNDLMTEALFSKFFIKFEKERKDKFYPIGRLLLHLFPPSLKLFPNSIGVCSEFVSFFYYKLNLLDYWMGFNPDWLADIAKNWKHWNIIYEGVL